MYIKVLCLGIVYFFVGVTLILMLRFRKKKDTIFHCQKYEFFNKEIESKNDNIFVRVMADILCKKLWSNRPKFYSFQDYDFYQKLRLIYAPVYVYKSKKFSIQMFHLFFRSIELCNTKINLTLKNKYKKWLSYKKVDDNIQIYFLEKTQILHKKYAFFNVFDVNFDYFSNFDKKIELFNSKNICNNFIFNYQKKQIFVNDIQNVKNEIQIILPTNVYGYANKKCKNGHILYDIFGKHIFSFFGGKNGEIFDNILTVKTNKKSSIKFEIFDTQFLDKIGYIFDYKIMGKSRVILYINILKNLAMKQCINDCFSVYEKLMNYDVDFYQNQIKKMGLQKFVQYANLIKDYALRYYFLVKYVFKIQRNSDGIFCYPDMRFAPKIFCISYTTDSTNDCTKSDKYIYGKLVDLKNISYSYIDDIASNKE